MIAGFKPVNPSKLRLKILNTYHGAKIRGLTIYTMAKFCVSVGIFSNFMHMAVTKNIEHKIIQAI